MQTVDRTLTAAVCVLIYAIVIGYTDNYVRVIAVEAGLWQFHATRTAMALPILAVYALVFGRRLRPVNMGAVVARSAIHGFAMVIYFGALAFLPVAQVAAGLFTAPIFVLLMSRFAYGQPIGPLRIMAVVTGFVGVILVLGPAALAGASWAAALPAAAGALYALGNIATRQWCSGETAETLLGGFSLALGILGVVGLAVLAVLQPEVPQGPAGFVYRGYANVSTSFYYWTFVQAAGSLFGVGMMIKAYQLSEASRVSVFEYIILPASAFWGWFLWDESLSTLAILGMVLITVAGGMITLRAPQHIATDLPKTA